MNLKKLLNSATELPTKNAWLWDVTAYVDGSSSPGRPPDLPVEATRKAQRRKLKRVKKPRSQRPSSSRPRMTAPGSQAPSALRPSMPRP